MPFADGAWAAALWTFAATPTSPVTFVPLVLDDAALRREIAAARLVIDADGGQRTVTYARGVLAWFAWLAGAAEDVGYGG